jgi:hypothetical protein
VAGFPKIKGAVDPLGSPPGLPGVDGLNGGQFEMPPLLLLALPALNRLDDWPFRDMLPIISDSPGVVGGFVLLVMLEKTFGMAVAVIVFSMDTSREM